MRLIRGLTIVLVCVLAPLPAAADWVRLRAEHFEFIGDAPARDITRIARSLEQFREVMARVVPALPMP
jgi:hypothetical protein